MKKLNLLILALTFCSALAQPLELPAYGFGDLSTIPVPQSYIEENYIGDAPLEAILNHRNNDKYWRIARSVGLLDMVLTRNGSTLRSVCTATLISNDLILTNAHCIPGKDANSQVVAATLHMGYDQKGLETVRYPVNTQPIDTDFDLDYTVLSVGDNPGARFGYVTLNMRAPIANERLFIIQHPEGQAKQISRNCIIFSSAGITGIEIRHRCDTRGGSSGSLVFAESDGSVVGLHFASSFQDSNPPPPAERFNLAKRLDAIFRDSAYLPEQLSSAPPANPTPTPAPPTPAPVPAQPVVQQGYLSVTSSPSGATVSVDGIIVGTTPLRSLAYDVGTYQLRLSYNGYETHSENIRISAGQSLQRTITLRAEAPKQGYLSVTSSPSGASVAVNGRVIGTTPLSNRAYNVGNYQLSLSYNGYQSYSESINIRAGQSLQRSITLRANQPELIRTADELVRRARQGGTLRLAAGTFRLSSTLVLSGDVRLIGQGYQQTRIVSSASEYVVRYTGGGTFAAQGVGFEHTGNTIAHVTIVDNGTLDIDSCQFTKGKDDGNYTGGLGLWIRGSTRGTVRNSLFNGNGLHGIQVSDNAQPRLEQNRLHDNTQTGIAYAGSAGGSAVSNESYGNGLHGIFVADNAQPRLEQNRLHDNTQAGIDYKGSAGGSAVGNESYGNGLHGIFVADNAQPRLEQNRLHDNTQSGISYAGSAGGSAVSNESFSNGYHGIGLKDNAQPRLEQNRLHDNTESGIVYFNQSGGSARNNQSYNNGINGIYVASTANPSLSNNTTYGNRQGDIVDQR